MEARQMLVDKSKYSVKCPYVMTPTRIVVHNTANDASANNEIKYMISNNNEVSFHFAVDDKEVVQGIPLNRNAWHAGDGHGKGNMEGIAIEICYSKSGGDRFIKAEQNAAKFIAQLLKERGWGIDKVTKHQDYSGKYCPHRTLDMGWERFLNMIRSELGQAQVNISTASNSSSSKNYTGKITYQSYDNVKKKWLSEVNSRNYDSGKTNSYAGNFGNDLGGLRAKPEYGEIKIQAHVLNGKWLSEVSSNSYVKNDKKYGYTYAGLRDQKLDAIKITSTKGYVTYQVHIKEIKDENGKVTRQGRWLPEVDSRNAKGNDINSYAGNFGEEIDAIRMK